MVQLNTSLISRQVRELQGKYRDAAYLFGLVSVIDVRSADLAPNCIQAGDYVRTIGVVKGDDGEGFSIGDDDKMLVGKVEWRQAIQHLTTSDRTNTLNI
jgi:hypothetical protein